MLKNNINYQQLKLSSRRGNSAPILTTFDPTVEHSVANSSVVLQDGVGRCSSAGLQKQFQKMKCVLNKLGRYVPKVDKDSPVRFQLLLGLLGDNVQPREKMLYQPPVEVFRIMGRPKETIPNVEVTITDWFRFLCLKGNQQPAFAALKAKVLHELSWGKTKTFPNAAARLVRSYRAQ